MKTDVSTFISDFFLLSIIAVILLYGIYKKVNAYDAFIGGAREAFQIGFRIAPYLVAFLVGIGMFRAAGGFELMAKWLGPFLSKVGFPTELLPVALVRPFSGAASNAIFVDIAKNFGGDSWLAHTAATLIGSTETTFYVIMIYFGAVNITRTRHAIPAGLIADGVGIVAAIIVSHYCY